MYIKIYTYDTYKVTEINGAEKQNSILKSDELGIV